jgi:hypothetical protein
MFYSNADPIERIKEDVGLAQEWSQKALLAVKANNSELAIVALLKCDQHHERVKTQLDVLLALLPKTQA